MGQDPGDGRGGQWGLVVGAGRLGARSPGFSPSSGRGVGGDGLWVGKAGQHPLHHSAPCCLARGEFYTLCVYTFFFFFFGLNNRLCYETAKVALCYSFTSLGPLKLSQLLCSLAVRCSRLWGRAAGNRRTGGWLTRCLETPLWCPHRRLVHRMRVLLDCNGGFLQFHEHVPAPCASCPGSRKAVPRAGSSWGRARTPGC